MKMLLLKHKYIAQLNLCGLGSICSIKCRAQANPKKRTIPNGDAQGQEMHEQKDSKGLRPNTRTTIKHCPNTHPKGNG
jgi:hypothetical protein